MNGIKNLPGFIGVFRYFCQAFDGSIIFWIYAEKYIFYVSGFDFVSIILIGNIPGIIELLSLILM